MAEDTRTNEEIIEGAIEDGWPDKWPADYAVDVVAALAAAGRLRDNTPTDPETATQVVRLYDVAATTGMSVAQVLETAGVLDELRSLRDALAESVAARANLEAVIGEAKALPRSTYRLSACPWPMTEDRVLVDAADLDAALSRAEALKSRAE